MQNRRFGANLGYLPPEMAIAGPENLNVNTPYDSYIQAIRLASDRIQECESGGIVAFVTNNGFIDSTVGDGLRKSLLEEFHKVYIVNLRGTIRRGGFLPKARREGEGGNIFQSGTTTGSCILILVKKPGNVEGAGRLFYHDTIDHPTRSRDQKIHFLAANRKSTIPWQAVVPDVRGDWINQRDPGFQDLMPLYGEDNAVFKLNSLGIATNRDAWCYDFSRAKAINKTREMMESYNQQIPTSAPTRDPKKFSWTRRTLRMAKNGIRMDHDSDHIVLSEYRPFTKQFVYFHRSVNEEVYQQERIFPAPHLSNVGIAINERDKNNPLSCLMLTALPDLNMMGNTQFLPRWTYEKALTGAGYERVSNINPVAFEHFESHFGEGIVTEDDVFHYVYGVIHHAGLRARYAANLSKETARIPIVASLPHFQAFARAGEALLDLHVNYESVEPYPLEVEITGNPGMLDLYRVTDKKMKHPSKSGNIDESALVYNEHITLRGIPVGTHRYMLGQYSALRWLMDRYRISTHTPSGIVKDPNDWGEEHGDPRYIIDLIKRIVTVSVKTMEIVDSLPELPQ